MAFYRVTFSSLFFCLYIILFSILLISCFTHSFLFVRSLLILSSYHFRTHFHLYVDPRQLYHTVPEPALDTSLKYPCHLASIYLLQALCPLSYQFMCPYYFIYLFFLPPSLLFTILWYFFFLAIFCSLPSFISASTNEHCHGQIDTGWSVCSQRWEENECGCHASFPPVCVRVCGCASSVFGWHVCSFTAQHAVIWVALLL